MVDQTGDFQRRIKFLRALRERRVTGRRRAGAGGCTLPTDAATDKHCRLLETAESLVRWTTSQLTANIIARSYPPPENWASAARALTFHVRDATQTIPTFCPGFSRASRIVGRPADYWRVLSTFVHLRDQYSNTLSGFNLCCSILRW